MIYGVVTDLFVFRIVKLDATNGASVTEVLVDWAGDSGFLVVHGVKSDPVDNSLFFICSSRKVTTFHPTGNLEAAGILKVDSSLVFGWFKYILSSSPFNEAAMQDLVFGASGTFLAFGTPSWTYSTYYPYAY